MTGARISKLGNVAKKADLMPHSWPYTDINVLTVRVSSMSHIVFVALGSTTKENIN